MAHFAIIGLGEVGTILARDLLAAGAPPITAFDIRPVDAPPGVTLAPSAPEAVRDAEIVVVAVTAAAVLDAMRALGPLRHAPLVLDCNSVSPAVKQEAAGIVEAAGGRYVEAAIMASIPPKGLRTPMLLGGPHAPDLVTAMEPYPTDLTHFSPEIGPASSVKMCRSVMVKGIEALAAECMLAARHYGVADHVLASLSDTLPHPDWPGLARYVISRALLHGARRAEEMNEVARTVAEAGVEPILSQAIARRQSWAAAQGRRMGPAAVASPTLPALLDALAAAGENTARATNC